MKKIHILILGLLCYLTVGCYSDYDYDSNRYVSLQIQDALLFENMENYVVGDTIYFELNFERYLDEEGFSNKLDIFESSGSETFRYDFGLEKFSEISDGFRRVDISSEFLIAEKGKVSEFGSGIAQLNQDKTLYESRIGIILAESGRFNFDFDFLYISSTEYLQDKVQIEIQHRFTGDPPNFEINVTE